MISRIWIACKRRGKIVVELLLSLFLKLRSRDKLAREKDARLVNGGRQTDTCRVLVMNMRRLVYALYSFSNDLHVPPLFLSPLISF